MVIGLGAVDQRRLPPEGAVSTLTLAELASGPPAAADELARVRRQQRIRQAEAAFESLSFDLSCAHAYGRIYAAVVVAGRNARGSRSADLMIAATALSHRLPLYTLNATDFRGLGDLLEIVDLSG